jgi:hypothetical protein
MLKRQMVSSELLTANRWAAERASCRTGGGRPDSMNTTEQERVAGKVPKPRADDALGALRAELIAKGVTSESPGRLDDEGERLAREERWTEA